MLRRVTFYTLVVVFIFYAVIAVAVTPLSHRALDMISDKADKIGMKLHKIYFESVVISSPIELTWKEAVAQVTFPDKEFFLSGKVISVSAEKFSLRIKNLQKRKFGLNIQGLTLQIVDQAEEDPMEYIEGQNLELKFELHSMKPDEISKQAKNWANGLSDLLIYGKTTWPITFSGATHLTFRGKPARVRLSVHPEGDHYALSLYRQDLNELAKRLVEPITEAELDLISKYPLRAPALLKISDYAALSARAASKKIPTVSENCYRHVLWSYLLTKQFGVEFAKTLTDAHEAATVDGEGDRDIDLRNNEVGRSYALEKIPEASILPRLLTDPRAVLNAKEWPKMKNAKLPPAKKK